MNIINNHKTRLLRDFNFCKKVFNKGIETDIQLQSFTNLCQAYVNNCNHITKQTKPVLGILQYKKHKEHKSLEQLCIDTVADLSGKISSTREALDKVKEEAEMYEQIETRMRIEAAVAFDIKEQERLRQMAGIKKPIGYGHIIDINNDNNNGCTEI
jgi:hypothetical protein